MHTPDQDKTDMSAKQAACSLEETEAQHRADWVRENIISDYRRITEVDDGYELGFDASERAITALAQLVYMEADCCSQNTFELELTPPYEEVTLTITGPKGTKRLVEQGLVNEFDAVPHPE